MATVLDKSTAIGGGKDLAQDTVDRLTLEKVNTPQGAFRCFQAAGGGNIYINADDDQRGSTTWSRFCTEKIAAGNTHASQAIIDAVNAFNGTEDLATVQAQLKAFINEMEYVERPEADTRTVLS